MSKKFYSIIKCEIYTGEITVSKTQETKLNNMSDKKCGEWLMKNALIKNQSPVDIEWYCDEFSSIKEEE